LVDWCFTARQHKIGQFVLIYQGIQDNSDVSNTSEL